MALDGVTFENCQVASDSASIKFGTGTTNPIRNILYNNIRVHGPKGIRIDNLDGSIIENVTFSNITFEDSVDQMFLCGGGSLPTKECRGDREGGTPRGTIQNICYTDITVKGGATTVDPGQYGESSINGMRNITLRNINFESGAGSPPLAKFRDISGLAFENITYSGKRYDDPRSLFEIQGSVSGITPNGNPYGCQPGSPPAKSPTPIQILAGDLDKDRDVDIFDYNILIENFGNTNCGNIADIDGNCKVDIFDYNILVENFGK